MSSEQDFAALLREMESYRKTDPLRYLRAVALAKDITGPELRFLRAESLHALATRLHAGLRLCAFANEVVVRPEGVFVNVGGVLMESSRAGMYWKPSGEPVKNQGEALSRILRRMNIAVSTAVDVGANFGEISLWLARDYPAARIVAIEPSSENLSVFKLNKDAQSFPTGNLEIVHEAVTADRGTVTLTTGASSMNHIAAAGAVDGTETVNCDRLDTLFDRHGVRTADFVKIDIEGAEPLLKEALTVLGERVRSYYIEFSQFAPFDEYAALASALLTQKFSCYDEAAAVRLKTIEDIAQHLRSAFAAGPQTVTNLWFFAPSIKPARA